MDMDLNKELSGLQEVCTSHLGVVSMCHMIEESSTPPEHTDTDHDREGPEVCPSHLCIVSVVSHD